MIHLSPQDYMMERIEIPDGVCYWEPQGNEHFYTTCGNLIFQKDYEKKKITNCLLCGKKIWDGKKV